AFVNDTPVNLDSLSVLGEQLIDIHSQHQTLELANNAFQFQVIDALAGNTATLETYQSHLSEYKAAKQELDDLLQLQSDSLKEQDYNAFLLNELVEVNLVDGEQEKLEEEYEALNNVEEIREQLASSHQIMSNEQSGILSLLLELKQQLQKLSEYGSAYSDIFKRTESSFIELKDIFSEIEAQQESIIADPNRLETVNTKLQQIHSLLQKHQVGDIKELLSIQQELTEKVEVTEQLDDRIETINKTISSLESKLKTLGRKLTKSREEAIPQLTTQLESILKDLGMPDARFDISISQKDLFFSNGMDELNFLFSANKGGNFNELKKAASGGELSRIMLAIKSILSKYINLPTIMFDEIDTGVSGEISNQMANIMQKMSKSMQVFTITHLPQIAAKGDTHFKVYKEVKDNLTTTEMKKLGEEERIVEIAQMLGGKQVTDSAVAHAKQLLN
ncbi:MAG: DNA repair protein RecN, partial [Flavobacteriaceae bacterium]|nr:DNA repair protein RecN [Flavobacteriaceae bacterium]